MADTIEKIYRLQSVGGSAVLKELRDINKQFIEIKKNKLDLNGVNARIEDPDELRDVSQRLVQLAIQERELIAVLKAKQIELVQEQTLAKQLQVQRQQELNQQRQIRNGNEALAGSYNDIAKKYRELRAIALNAVDLANPQEVEQAVAELKRLKDQLDNFNRALSSDGTLVGEYTRGIANAFRQMGLGGFIEQKIQRDKAALQQLDRQFNLTREQLRMMQGVSQQALDKMEADLIQNRQEAARLRAQIQEISVQVEKTGGIGSRALGAIEGGFKNLIRTGGQMLLTYFSIQAVISAIQSSFQKTMRLEGLTTALATVSKTQAELATNQRFLRESADQLGLEILDTTQAYKGFYTASTLAGISAKDTRDIFRGATEASATLKLSQDETNGVLLAFGQIASKGKVQAEELRGQIGERIPGAFSIAARAIGVTEAELNKMLETGQVTARDFLPKFGAELRKTFGVDGREAVDGLQASVNRFQNELTRLSTGGALGGFFQSIIDGAKDVIKALNDMGGTAEEVATRTAITAHQEAVQAQNLVDEYEKLQGQVNQTSAEKRRLEEIVVSLTGIFGQSVAVIDQETGALKLNLQATKDLIGQKLLLANQEAASQAAKLRYSQEDLKNLQTQRDIAKRSYDVLQNQIGVTDTRLKREGEGSIFDPATRDVVNGMLLKIGDSAALNNGQFIKLVNTITKFDQKIDDTKEKIKEYGKNLEELGFKAADVDKLLNPNESPAGGPTGPPAGSLAALKKELKEVTAQLQTAIIGTEKYNQLLARQKELTQQIKEAEGKSKPAGTSRLTGAQTDALRDIDAARDQQLVEERLRIAERRRQNDFDEAEEIQHLKALQKIYTDATAKKLAAIDAGNAAERQKRAQVQLDQINQEDRTNEEIFKRRVDAAQRLRQNTENTAQQGVNAVGDDPAATDLQKAQAQEQFYTKMVEAQRTFNATIDALEKELGIKSQKNQEDRNNALIDLQRKQSSARVNVVKEGLKADIETIQNTATTGLLEVQQDVLTKAQAIFADQSSSATDKQRRIQRLQIQAAQEMAKIDIAAIDQEQARLDLALKNKELSQQEYNRRSLELTRDRINKETEANAAQLKKEQEQQNLRRQAIEAGTQILGRYLQGQTDQKYADIEANYQSAKSFNDAEKEKRLTQAQSAAEKKAIEKEYDEKEKELDRKRNIERQDVARKQLAVEFALASIKAISTSSNIYEGLVKEAIVVAEYLVALKTLNSQKFAAGGQLGYTLYNGGIFSGPSHAGGGIPFMFRGAPTEVEGREGYVINKSSMASGSVLTATGTPAQLASAANVAGGGVNFAPGAAVSRFDYGGALGYSLQAPNFTTAAQIQADNSTGAIDKLAGMVTQLMGVVAMQQSRMDNMKVAVPVRDISRIQDADKRAAAISTL